MPRENTVSKIVFTVLILFGFWLLLVSTLNIQEVIFGFAIAVLISLGSYRLFTEHGLSHMNPKRLLVLIIFIPYYIVLVIYANLDMAYRVLSPSLPIKPGIVEVKTELKTDSGKLALANSITLTPGTITMDIIDDRIFVHWIYVRDESIEGSTKVIVKPFEKLLKVIFS